MISTFLLMLAAPTAEAPAVTRGLYLQLIRQARADGRPRAALAYLDDFDSRYRGDRAALILRINSLLDLGEIDAAEAAAAQLPADASAVRGHLLAARGRWGEAIPFYEAAIRTSPADPLPRNALGYAQLRTGRLPQAIETLRGAQDLAPADHTIRNNLLLALTMAGRRPEVEAALRQIRDGRQQDALRQQLAAEAVRLSIPREH